MKRSDISLRFVQIALLATLAVASVSPIAHATEEASPIAVKAAYLRVLAKLVTWPDTAFAEKSSPMVIGVLGDDPFKDHLDEAIRGKTGNKRKLKARRLAIVDGELPSKERLSDCHVLFVSASERERLGEIFERLEGTHVLTVSDVENFTKAGGTAQLQLVGAHILVRLNLQASKAAGLRPSARLTLAAALDKAPDDPAQSD